MTVTDDTSAPPPADAQPPLDLADIQGNILRGYRHPDVRHLALFLTDAAGGKKLLQTLIDGDGPIPDVTTAEEWDEKPTACLNVALTAAGLSALGVAADTVATFPASFVAGAAARAVQTATDTTSMGFGVGLGDVGDSAPSRWMLGGPANPSVHVVVSLWTDEETRPMREEITTALRAVFDANGVIEVRVLDGHTFPGGKIHFGYKDGISQPQVEGRPGARKEDQQPMAPTGDFLLGKGYKNTYHGNFLEGTPPELGANGTYMVLRILEQDVEAFDRYTTVVGDRVDMTQDMVKAKLVGRWPDGTSLVRSPKEPGPALAENQLNDFDYAPNPSHPMNYDDVEGLRCPLGSHMRRMNPRSGAMTGVQHNHRIIRRGVPYGPAYDPDNPVDAERGLLGVFICGDIENQFELLQSTWANMDFGTPGVVGSRDPIIGWQPPIGGEFTLPTGDVRGTRLLDDLPAFVTTRGCVYTFMPGITGLRTLAGS